MQAVHRQACTRFQQARFSTAAAPHLWWYFTRPSVCKAGTIRLSAPAVRKFRSWYAKILSTSDACSASSPNKRNLYPTCRQKTALSMLCFGRPSRERALSFRKSRKNRNSRQKHTRRSHAQSGCSLCNDCSRRHALTALMNSDAFAAENNMSAIHTSMSSMTPGCCRFSAATCFSRGVNGCAGPFSPPRRTASCASFR